VGTAGDVVLVVLVGGLAGSGVGLGQRIFLTLTFGWIVVLASGAFGDEARVTSGGVGGAESVA
jgi:hypothetical protein